MSEPNEQEWTAERGAMLPQSIEEMEIVVNAALAAEREKTDEIILKDSQRDLMSKMTIAEVEQLREQLATEKEWGQHMLNDLTSQLAAEREAHKATIEAGRQYLQESQQQLAAAVEALEKALDELESPSVYEGEVQDGYSADHKVIEQCSAALARLKEGK